MKTADALNAIKPAEKHLHGGGLSLPPEQLPFNLLLGAGAAAHEPDPGRQVADDYRLHSQDERALRQQGRLDESRRFEAANRSPRARGECRKSEMDVPASDSVPAPSDEPGTEDREEAVAAAWTIAAPASVPIADANEPLSEEQEPALTEGVTIQQANDAALVAANVALAVAAAAPVTDETNIERPADAAEIEVAEDAAVATAGAEADAGAKLSATVSTDGKLPTETTAEVEQGLKDADGSVKAELQVPESIARNLEPNEPTAGTQDDGHSADQFEKSPSATGEQPPEVGAEAKALSVNTEPTTSAPLPPTSHADVTPGAVAGPPASPVRALPTSIPHSDGESVRPPKPIEVDSTRLLHRVARAFHAAQQRGGEIKLRLNPPELGSLRLELRIDDGVMIARMETETSTARTAIIDSLPALRERLAEQGVRVERFDVDLMQQPGQESGARNQGSERESERVAEWERGRVAPRSTEKFSPVSPAPPLAVSTANGLNVLV